MKATKIAFEQRYADDSGVEKAVSYDATQLDGEVSLQHHGAVVSFPVSDIEWLRDALFEIQHELPEKPKAA
jgi:hypothetical protein